MRATFIHGVDQPVRAVPVECGRGVRRQTADSIARRVEFVASVAKLPPPDRAIERFAGVGAMQQVACRVVVQFNGTVSRADLFDDAIEKITGEALGAFVLIAAFDEITDGIVAITPSRRDAGAAQLLLNQTAIVVVLKVRRRFRPTIASLTCPLAPYVALRIGQPLSSMTEGRSHAS